MSRQENSTQRTPGPPRVVNVAAYKFVTLDGLKRRRKALRELCSSLGLRGSILLSTGGINLFVAGGRDAGDRLIAFLRADPALSDLAVKESSSPRQPFRRMLVKIKKEIIAFSVEGIDPEHAPAPRISPRELKRWLDDGRRVLLLDARNEYEIAIGTFRGARSLGLDQFRDFPRAARSLPEDLKRETVVAFCTGGIRCEKAGPYLTREGFRDVYQLEGGILRYFEECGGAHFEGDCFVFDHRTALDSRLEPTDLESCFACRTPLTREERRSPLYERGKSCPRCAPSTRGSRVQVRALREEAIRAATTPLPGSIPYDNSRPMNVPRRFADRSLVELLTSWHPQVPRDEWRRTIREGRIVDRDGAVPEDRVVRAGDRLEHRIPATLEPGVDPRIRILHEDDWIVVISKPAPLPVHPCGRFNRNTLEFILSRVYRQEKLRPVHRLDANTSGVVVLARTRSVARRIQPHFENHEVEKTYLARVIGSPEGDRFSCSEPIGAAPSSGGVRVVDRAGSSARTDFQVVFRTADGTTLLEAHPATGRTNQIRLHLWHLGLPVLGDPAYCVGGRLGTARTLGVDEPPLCLHALRIAFPHPGTGEQARFEAEKPRWADPSMDPIDSPGLARLT